jgi:transposase
MSRKLSEQFLSSLFPDMSRKALQDLKLDTMYSKTKLKQKHTMNKTNQLYVGLDVHKISWSVCIRTEEFEHRTFQQPADPEILYRYLHKNFPDYAVTIAYEAGCFGFWISRRLQEKGYRCLVLNAADIPGSDKESKRKSDHSDCRKIARELSKNELIGIYQPQPEQEAFRCMFRQRETLVIDLRKAKGRIRSLLSCYGIVCPEQFEHNNWSRAFGTWLEQLSFEHVPLRIALNSLLTRLDFLRKQILAIEMQIRHYVKTHFKKEYLLLMSIPGIGPIVSQAILAEIGDISRFKRIDDLCSFIGLVPNIYQSGDTRIVSGLTRRSHYLLRSYFVEAAWMAVRKDPELTAYYKKYTGKMIPAKIIVKVTRKLIVRVYYCLKTKQPYQINHNSTKQEIK